MAIFRFQVEAVITKEIFSVNDFWEIFRLILNRPAFVIKLSWVAHSFQLKYKYGPILTSYFSVVVNFVFECNLNLLL